MSLTQNNFDYAHCSPEANCDCTHSIYTQSKNYAYTHVTHSTYKPISPVNNRIETI